jgi:hypothetical protein
MPSRSPIAVGLFLVVAGLAHGDEALRRDGTRLTGQLSFSKERDFTFTSDGVDRPIETLEAVRFAAKAPPARPVPFWHQVHFGHGEVCQAEIRKLDATSLNLRPAWEGSLEVARAAVEHVTHEPAWQPIFFDAFDDGLARWEKSGQPLAKANQVRFVRDGQAIATTFKTPLDAGRIGITWHAEFTKTRRLTLVLAFDPHEIRVELVGPGDRYGVATALKADHAGQIKRKRAECSLSAEFGPDRLVICIDDLVLWASDSGVKALRSMRIESTGDGDEGAVVTSVQVARQETGVTRKPWADLTADAVRSPAGDETFGSILSTGPAGITLKVKEKELALAWPDVGDFAFRRALIVERETNGEHVRIRVRSANGVRDVLEGAVTAYDAKSMKLAHAVLGDLTFPRECVDEIRLDFRGRRVPVDSTPRHLGSRPAFGFAVVKPEGLRFAKSIDMPILPRESVLVVDAAQVDKQGAPAEVLVNGAVVGTLNHLADRGDQTVRTYRLAVPVAQWRQGANEIEVRVRPPEGAKVKGIDLRAIRLDFVARH